MSNLKILNIEVSRKISFFMLVFIFIVVLFHSDFRYYYPFIEELTAVSTSYFFWVSGFFFYKGLSNENLAMRLKKRCSTLLLPYLLWNLIYMIFYCKTYEISLINVINGFTVSPLCIPSWYLLTLFIFLLPAPIIKRFFSKIYLSIILLSLSIVISYLGYVKFQTELATVPYIGGYLIRMAEYLTPYLLGGIIGTWFNQKIYVNWKICIAGITSSCVIIMLLRLNIPTELKWLLWIMLPLALWESVPEKIFKYVEFLPLFTAPAFLINMTHCYLLYALKPITMKMEFVTGKYHSALNVIFAVIVSYVLYYLLKLILPELLKILTGNRVGKI